MFKKRAYTSMMTYQISDPEKDQAEKAMRWFNHCLKRLEQCDEHLNLIYNPFKKHPDITPEKIFKRRAMLRTYRDKVVENFNNFKKAAFKAYVIMQPFTSDTQTEKLMKSFVSSIEDIEIQVNRFVDLFSDLKSEDFSKGIVTAIENIKKEIVQLEQIVDERVKDHLQTNILARNWVDSVSNELQEKVEKNSPLVMQLVEDRMKMLDETNK
jgi:hypothetical protein